MHRKYNYISNISTFLLNYFTNNNIKVLPRHQEIQWGLALGIRAPDIKNSLPSFEINFGQEEEEEEETVA